MTSLHNRTISMRRSDGSEHQVAALDPSRSEDIGFIKYTQPPADNSDPAAVDEWIERATLVEDDLHWLLRLPYDRFWCQLIFDNTLHQCIDSFLREAPRPHDTTAILPASRALPPEVSQHLVSLRRLFFFVCLRGSTHRETPTDLIAPDVFGDIIYENYVFDIARLMDICAVYGQSINTAQLVGKMIGNIFEHQSKYTDDLYEIVPTILQVFSTICAKCGIDSDGVSQHAPAKKLSDISKSFRAPIEAMPTSDFEDIVLYISDIAHTLNSFLKVYPPGALAFYSCNFPVRLASTYEQLTSAFDSAFRNRIWQDLEKMESIKRQFRRAQVSLLRIFRFIVYQNCLRPITDGSSNDDAIRDGVEGYLEIMGSLLSEKRFLAHLHVLFPFSGDRQIVLSSTYLVDETRLSYIDNAIADANSRHGKNPPRKNESEEPVIFEPEDGEVAPETGYQCDYEGPDEDLGACAAKITGLELDSLVSCVRDLLPELGIGFVKLCLEEYGYDTEKVVNALLEDNLRPSLQGINRTLADIGTSTTDTIQHRPSDDNNTPSLLKERHNIYDGDEFDVFSQRTIDTDKVHQGKRDTDVLTIVNSKLAPDIRARYAAAYAYSEIDPADIDENDLENVVEYDDEYDDTYDSNIVGPGDADSADEMLARRPFVMPRIFARSSADSRATGRNEDYEEEEETEGSPAPPRDTFLEDPAKLRQQREERYAAQRQQRAGGPRWHSGGGGTGAPAQQQSTSGATTGGGQGPPSRDLKGGPKGQGQSSDVLKNRAWKEKNKATRVHHNRKDLADRKRRI